MRCCSTCQTAPQALQVLQVLFYVAGSGERGDSEPDSEGGPQATVSEDEFAEDELSLGEGGLRGVLPPAPASGTSSLQGSTGNDLCRDVDSSDADDRSRFLGGRNFSLPPGQRSRLRPHHRPRSLDRRRRHKAQQGPEVGDFHEGVLLDALLQFYPPVNHPPPTPYILPVPSRHASPYESVPVLSHLHQHPLSTFRPPPKPVSHDSDSGYSHGGQGTSTTSRGRKDHRLSSALS